MKGEVEPKETVGMCQEVSVVDGVTEQSFRLCE